MKPGDNKASLPRVRSPAPSPIEPSAAKDGTQRRAMTPRLATMPTPRSIRMTRPNRARARNQRVIRSRRTIRPCRATKTTPIPRGATAKGKKELRAPASRARTAKARPAHREKINRATSRQSQSPDQRRSKARCGPVAQHQRSRIEFRRAGGRRSVGRRKERRRTESQQAGHRRRRTEHGLR